MLDYYTAERIASLGIKVVLQPVRDKQGRVFAIAVDLIQGHINTYARVDPANMTNPSFMNATYERLMHEFMELQRREKPVIK